MLYAFAKYPAPELPPVAAVLLEGFHANERCRGNDFEGGVEMADLDYQRCCALYEGSRSRALEAGPKDDHATQAATLLVMIDDLDCLLDGSLGNGMAKLDPYEVDALRRVRAASETLLPWHFDNGAGGLLPIAFDLGLVHGAKA